jgi:predicted PurR-regulated permease PerM
MKEIGKYFLIILGLAFLVFILWFLKSIVAYILISAVISLIGNPLVNVLGKIRFRNFIIPRALRAAITLVVIWILMFAFFSFFIPLIANQANEFSQIDVEAVIENLHEPIQKLENLAGNFIAHDDNFSLQEYVQEKIISVLDVSQLSMLFGSVAGLFGDIFIAIFSISFISFFFLKDEKLFFNSIILLAPEKREKNVRHALISINKLLSRYFVGIVIEVSLIIILVTIGLSIVGLKLNHVLLIALFVGLMNVIPYVGPMIGALFGIIIGTATHLDYDFYTQLLPLLGFMSIVFISVQIIDNVLFQPLIYSSSVNAHPLEIFLVIMIAGSLVGISGMVLAIPTYTILRVIAKEFFNKFRVVKKLTEKM